MKTKQLEMPSGTDLPISSDGLEVAEITWVSNISGGLPLSGYYMWWQRRKLQKQ